MTDEENYILFLQSTTNTPLSSEKILPEKISTDLAIIEEIDFNKFIKSDDLEFLKTVRVEASGNIRHLNFNDIESNFFVGKTLISYENSLGDRISKYIVYVHERYKNLKSSIFYKIFETDDLAFKFFRVIFDIKDLYKKVCTKCNGSEKYMGFTSIEDCECVRK